MVSPVTRIGRRMDYSIRKKGNFFPTSVSFPSSSGRICGNSYTRFSNFDLFSEEKVKGGKGLREFFLKKRMLTF
ncbi:hypothetical protein A0128_17205 [Leptospira tipperaryensis]|uniref:Uncharacterized protein n=1 Tax=Leptospira tipperaryensis TaxID=2564040 RepID=A0A1D7V0R2_9LEPT|nr:hypothetical protein A0128_17205 [Leptospira tipperaryensis]